MIPFVAMILFLSVAIGMSIVGMRFYVKPKEAIDRLSGLSVHGFDDRSTTHPSLMFRDLVLRFSNVIPATPSEVTMMQRRLIRAGMRGENALKILYGSKAVLAALFPILYLVGSASSGSDVGQKLMLAVAAGAAGFFAPNLYVDRKGKARAKKLHRGLSNALDLLVICVESGLGLDQAIMQTAKELETAYPDISEEFALVNLELKAGKRRVDSLRNLADRTSVEDLKKLVAVLIQADRFGTGIAQSLRAHADYMRVQARQIAEEKAAKLGVKLIFPIFFCILPSLFVVTVGPVMVKIVTELIPMMQNV